MTCGQENLFHMYGKKCIIIDSTHGMTPYKLVLTTIMVLYECGFGFPVAFLYSRTINFIILTRFLRSILARLGTTNFSTRIFMQQTCNITNQTSFEDGMEQSEPYE